jgi:hypothetical protein
MRWRDRKAKDVFKVKKLFPVLWDTVTIRSQG